MKRLFLCFLSLMLLSVNMSLAEIQDKSTHWILPLETTPSTYTDYQGVIYKLNSAKNAYTVTGHTDDFNLDLTIPNQLFGSPVTAIGDDALGWSDLQSITLPEGIETIGMNAISDCQITSLHIPASVNSLYPNDDNTFSCNKRLTSITVAVGNTIYDSRNNCNAIIETSTNRLVSGCTNTIIPNTVTSIGNDAFYGCLFSTITLPSGITSIGGIAFADCSKLKNIYALMKTPATLDGGAFDSYHYNNATLYVPKGCKTAYQQADVWSYFQNIVEIDGDVPGSDDIIMIDDSTFSAKTFEGVRMVFKILDPVAKTVQVGNDTVSIDRSTAGTVTIPTFVNGYTVVGIGRSGFNSCAELTTVWLPDSLQFIGDYAFYGCTKLRTIQIPETVYGISESAFVGCSGLTNVSCPYIPGVNLGVVFPPSANLEIIGYKASDEDYDVVIPRLVNSIGQRTFSYCPSIRTMRVEEGNSVYDSRDNCNAIILTAENKLLYGCKNTIIPESVTAIESYAFEGHTGLVAIAIPAAVKTIGNGAFTACTGLTSVTSRIKTPYAIDDSVFSGQTYRTATLYVPVGTKALYQKAKGWKNFLNIEEQEEVNPDNCEPYAVYQDGVLTFYYDDKKGMREGTVYGLNKGKYEYPSWYNDHRTDITKAVFDNSFAGARPTSTYRWFAVEYNETSNLTEIQGIQNLNTSNVTNMERMFYGCSSLTSLDVSHFDTRNVTSMSYMFFECTSLTSLDMSHFDTGNVTSMFGMFDGCSSLTSLDVSHFDTGNVTNMGSMFYGCSGLTSLDVSHFDTGNVTYIDMMFYGCGGLTSLDVSHFDAKNVTGMYAMFRGCSSLTSLDLSHFDTSNVTSMLSMFYGCSSLTSLDVSHFDTGNVTDMSWMFYGCSNLSNIYCNETWTCSSSTRMFYDCKSLPGYNSANTTVDYAKPIDLGGYFTRAENNPNGIIDFADAEVKRICVENWDTNGDGELSYGEAAAVTDLNMRFYYNHEIEYFNELKYFTGLKNIRSSEFGHCVKLSHVELPNTIESIGSYAFHNAPLYEMKLPESLKTIGNWAFQSCRNLSTLYIPMNVEQIGSCITSDTPFMESVIVDEDNPKYDSRGNCNAIIETVTNTLLLACKNTVIPNTVTTIGTNAYCWCKGIQSIILPNSVTKIDNQGIYGCIDLESIKIPNSVTSIGEKAFMYCDSLKSVIVDIGVPLPIGEQTFSNRTKAFLYVPYGCKAAYEAADYWKEFKEIIEMIPDNYLHADDVTICPGVQKTITLQLDNENTFVAGEFRLQLPAGMRIETDEDGEPVANLVSGRSNKHTLMVTDEGNGLYHFMFYSGQNRVILGNSGDFISLSVIADEGVEDGSYTAKLKNVLFSTEDEKRIDLPDVSFNINVLDYTPGDVNGDGSLNVMDVVKLVNYIMGRNPSDFVFAAADMDENDKINVMDLVNVVDIIMSTPQYAPAKSNNMASFSRLILDKTDKNIISMSVPEADRHIAAQFVVTLKGNAVLNDVLSDNDHQSEVTRMSDGRYKVMVYSGKNDVFKNNRPISLQLSGNSDVMIEDVVFVDSDEEAVVYEPAMTNTTGIMVIDTEFSQPTDIYTVGGSLVKKNATSMHGLASGVYIVNNEKIVIK